jgi:hypothetical protein
MKSTNIFLISVFFATAVLTGCFTSVFAKDSKAENFRYCNVDSSKKEFSNLKFRVYRIPILEINGEMIGDKNATKTAEQEGIKYIERTPGSRKKD